MKIKNGEKVKVNRSETQDYQNLMHQSNYINAAAERTSRANVSLEMHHGPVKLGKISI